MKRILAIVGDSGSGKTSLGLYLGKLGYRWIVSYTTRPMREGETDGVQHMFVSDGDYPGDDAIMAYADFGGYRYWTTFHQFEDGMNVYVIDEDALVEMEDKIKGMNDFSVIKIYIKRNGIDVGSERMERDRNRTRLPVSYYDLVIENDTDEDTFLRKSADAIGNIIKQKYGSYR